MARKKTFIILSILSAAILVTSAGMPQPQENEPGYSNLKVLPKNINRDDLDKVMHHYNKSLGVKCNFCHAPAQNGGRGLDFASDEKPEKKIARDMMRMTSKLNIKYFGSKKDVSNHAVMEVNCNTCHRGKTHPEE